MKAIAYLSRAKTEFTQAQIDSLLEGARTFNQQANVTGVLLHNPGFFFQYIEGSDESVSKGHL